MDNKIKLLIRSREGTVHEGSADVCTFVNEVGPFDILPMHEQFVTTVKGKIIAQGTSEGVKEWEIKSGVLWVKGDRVEVFLGI